MVTLAHMSKCLINVNQTCSLQNLTNTPNEFSVFYVVTTKRIQTIYLQRLIEYIIHIKCIQKVHKSQNLFLYFFAIYI